MRHRDVYWRDAFSRRPICRASASARAAPPACPDCTPGRASGLVLHVLRGRTPGRTLLAARAPVASIDHRAAQLLPALLRLLAHRLHVRIWFTASVELLGSRVYSIWIWILFISKWNCFHLLVSTVCFIYTVHSDAQICLNLIILLWYWKLIRE